MTHTVRNVLSPSGNPVPNQYIITTPNAKPTAR